MKYIKDKVFSVRLSLSEYLNLDILTRKNGYSRKSDFLRLLINKEWNDWKNTHTSNESEKSADRVHQISYDSFAYRQHDDQEFRVFRINEIFSDIITIHEPVNLEIIQQALDIETSTMYVADWESHPVWNGNFNQQEER